MLDFLLIRPGDKKRIYSSLGKSLAAIEPPMWAGLMAGHVREKGYSVQILDADAENLSADEVAEKVLETQPVLVGVVVSGTNPSASTMNMTGARKILEAVNEKTPDVKTFLAGLHPSAIPETTMKTEHVDFLIEGEAFQALPLLLDAVKTGEDLKRMTIPGLWYRFEGEIVSNPPAELVKNLDSLPMIAWDILPMNKYRAHNWHCFDDPYHRQPYAVIYTSLGCPYTCSFCCINAIFGKAGIRYRSPEKVLEEIELLVTTYGVRNIKIMDEMFVLNEKHVMAICDGIIDRGYDLNIWAYARIDTVNDRILAKLKTAGFNWLAYGIEAGNQSVRSGVAKGRFDTQRIADTIRRTQQAGISVGGNYIFGLPDDTLETMRETLNLAIELNCEYANFYTAMAYPGSKLYADAIAAGGANLPELWEGYSQLGEETLPLPTRYLSSSEILKFRDDAFQIYYSSSKYLDMLRERHGAEAVAHVKQMMAHKIKRKHCQ